MHELYSILGWSLVGLGVLMTIASLVIEYWID